MTLRPLALACLVLFARPGFAADPLPAPDAASPPAPATLDTVEVRATAINADEERQFASQAKIVITREELLRLDAATVGELLRQLPGVNLAPPGGPGRGGHQRGEDRLTPTIVVDGMALPGGNRPAFTLPADLIERIEIIKQSTPEFPSGPGGTINLILRDAPDAKGGTWRAGLNANDGGLGARAGGTYGDREGEAGLILIGFGDTSAVSGGRQVDVETFAGGARTGATREVDEDSGRSSGVHLIARRTQDLGDGARLVISPFLFGRQGTLTNDTQKFTYTDPAALTGRVGDGHARDGNDTRNLNGRLAFDYKQRRPGQGETSAMLVFQGESNKADRSRREFDAGGTQTSAVDTTDEGRELGFRFRGKRSQAYADGAHLVTLGLDASYKETVDRRREVRDGVTQDLGAQARADSSEGEFALWAQDEWTFAESHTLTPGLRLALSSREVTDGAGLTIADDSVSWLPSLAYVWRATEQWNLRAGLAANERLPGVRDLSPVVRTTTGQNTLSNPDRAGNPGLRPETTNALNLGLEHFFTDKRGSAGLNLYLRDIEDRIARRVALEAGRYVARPVNFDAAREVSVVADFKWKPAADSGLSLRGNVSQSQFTVDDDTAFVREESPRRAASLGVDYEVKDWRTTFGGNLSYSSAFTFEANPDTEQTSIARTQLDLYVSKKFSNKLSLRVSVDNVTEEPSGDDNFQFDAGGGLLRSEFDRADGVRVFNISLEGKF